MLRKLSSIYVTVYYAAYPDHILDKTRSSAIADGQRHALRQLKPCQLLHDCIPKTPFETALKITQRHRSCCYHMPYITFCFVIRCMAKLLRNNGFKHGGMSDTFGRQIGSGPAVQAYT